MSLKTLTKLFKGKSERDNEPLLRGNFKDFPEDHLLYRQRDMFGDSQFPHTLVPNNLDAVLAFLTMERQEKHQTEFELQISGHQGEAVLMVEIFFPSGQHYVIGYLMYNPLKDVELPVRVKITPDDAKRFEGYEIKVLREKEADSRTDGDTRVFIKA